MTGSGSCWRIGSKGILFYIGQVVPRNSRHGREVSDESVYHDIQISKDRKSFIRKCNVHRHNSRKCIYEDWPLARILEFWSVYAIWGNVLGMFRYLFPASTYLKSTWLTSTIVLHSVQDNRGWEASYCLNWCDRCGWRKDCNWPGCGQCDQLSLSWRLGESGTGSHIGADGNTTTINAQVWKHNIHKDNPRYYVMFREVR